MHTLEIYQFGRKLWLLLKKHSDIRDIIKTRAPQRPQPQQILQQIPLKHSSTSKKTCASRFKNKNTLKEERDGEGKETKTNQEEVRNECNSCITSNTLSSKLHNIKTQAHSAFSTSNTSQLRGDTAEPAEPWPHSEAQHAPTLRFIFILCHPLCSSSGYLLWQRIEHYV